VTDTPASQGLLYALLNKHQSAKWLDMLENFVSHAILVVHVFPQVWIYVKEEYVEYWRYDSGNSEDWRKYKWATHVGLIPNTRERKRLKKAEKKEKICLKVFKEKTLRKVWNGYLQC
jgi:PhoPQ-activated pathogenicity-related protein